MTKRKGDIYKALADRIFKARASGAMLDTLEGTLTGRFKAAEPVMQVQIPKALPEPEGALFHVDFADIEKRILLDIETHGKPAKIIGMDLARPGGDMYAIVLRHPDGRLEFINHRPKETPLTQDRVSKHRRRRKRR